MQRYLVAFHSSNSIPCLNCTRMLCCVLSVLSLARLPLQTHYIHQCLHHHHCKESSHFQDFPLHGTVIFWSTYSSALITLLCTVSNVYMVRLNKISWYYYLYMYMYVVWGYSRKNTHTLDRWQTGNSPRMGGGWWLGKSGREGVSKPKNSSLGVFFNFNLDRCILTT